MSAINASLLWASSIGLNVVKLYTGWRFIGGCQLSFRLGLLGVDSPA